MGQPKPWTTLVPLASNNLRHLAHAYDASANKQHILVLVVMPNGWEGNRKCGVLLALHHRLEEGYSGLVNFTIMLT